MSKARAKFQVRVRSMTRATRVFNRGGWRDATRWSAWRKVGDYDTYEEAAAEANSARYNVGLQQVGVFFRGSGYRKLYNSNGDLIGVITGAEAYNKRRSW